jgi:hypothetical protein
MRSAKQALPARDSLSSLRPRPTRDVVQQSLADDHVVGRGVIVQLLVPLLHHAALAAVARLHPKDLVADALPHLRPEITTTKCSPYYTLPLLHPSAMSWQHHSGDPLAPDVASLGCAGCGPTHLARAAASHGRQRHAHQRAHRHTGVVRRRGTPRRAQLRQRGGQAALRRGGGEGRVGGWRLMTQLTARRAPTHSRPQASQPATHLRLAQFPRLHVVVAVPHQQPLRAHPVAAARGSAGGHGGYPAQAVHARASGAATPPATRPKHTQPAAASATGTALSLAHPCATDCRATRAQASNPR